MLVGYGADDEMDTSRRVSAEDGKRPRAKPPVDAPANRLGIVVGELSPEQKKGLSLSSGVMVLEVRPDSKADVRKGDILLTLVHKGQHTELKSVEQLNKLLEEQEQIEWTPRAMRYNRRYLRAAYLGLG